MHKTNRALVATEDFVAQVLVACGVTSHTARDLQVDERFMYIVEPDADDTERRYSFSVLLLGLSVFKAITIVCEGSVRFERTRGVTQERMMPSDIKITTFRADEPDYENHAPLCVAYGPSSENKPRKLYPTAVWNCWWAYCTEADMGNVDCLFLDPTDYFMRAFRFE